MFRTILVPFMLLILGFTQAFGDKVRRAAAKPDSLRNHLAANLIRSISGERPKDEFFDLRMKFSSGSRRFTLATVDAALSEGDSGDTKLADASFSYNFGNHPTAADPRQTFCGPLYRIFDTRSYLGVHLGGLESQRSKLANSMISVALLTPAPLTARNRWSNSALLVDFYLASTEDSTVISKLHLRGSIFLPWDTNKKPTNRIVVEVPIGKTIRF